MTIGSRSTPVRLFALVTAVCCYLAISAVIVERRVEVTAPPEPSAVREAPVEQAPAQPQVLLPAPVREAVDGAAGLVVSVGERDLHLPMLKTDYQVDVRGDLVAVRVKQRFENPHGSQPIEATYQFPLAEDSAVHAVTMRVGDEVVRAKIAEREDAKRQYAAAVAQGRVATLTSQHRPNLFTQKVGNVMPGMNVEVELAYVHAAERRDGHYELALPLVVGPRYSPGTEADPVPSPPPTAHAGMLDPERVSIDVRIDGGLPISDVSSSTHAVEVAKLGAADARVSLAHGRTVDNRDFELQWSLSGDDIRAAVLADYDPHAGKGWFSVLVEPPSNPGPDAIVPREMVFVIDCSGSMKGQPIEASKAFIKRALADLRPFDTFRIVRFSNDATEFFTRPLRVRTDHVALAMEYVDSLEAGGGTDMRYGIERAFAGEPADGALRVVTFLTDGFIGDDTEVIRLLRARIGDARLFALGVGTETNRYLIEELGRAGRGFARYVDPDEPVDAVAADFAERLQTPVFTDISVEVSTADVADLTPTPIPDLFAGERVRVLGTYEKPGRHEFVVTGTVRGRSIRIPIVVELPDTRADGEAVRLMWARSRIGELMHATATRADLRIVALDDAAIRREVTALGLEHALTTRWTAFVGASDLVANPGAIPNVLGNAVPPAAGLGSTSLARGIGLANPGVVGGKSGGYGRGGGGSLGERGVRMPRVVPGSPAVQGSLDKEIIRRVVRQHRQKIKYCYEKELQRNPSLKGRVVIRFTISPTGSVVSAVVRETTLGNQDAENCIASAVRRWKFPEPKGGGIVVVNYPFDLSAE